MKWNLCIAAAERGTWKSLEPRRMLAEAGMEISVGTMSKLWTATPTTLRPEDLDAICLVLDDKPGDPLTADRDAAAARRPGTAPGEQAAGGSTLWTVPRK